LNHFSDFGFMIVGDVPPEDFPAVFQAVTAQKKRVAFSLKLPVLPQAPDSDALEASVTQTLEAIQALQQPGSPDQVPLKVLYLDAPETILIQRYLNTDKRHPFESVGLEKGITLEKLFYRKFHAIKNYGIDTHTTAQNEMRSKVAKILGISLDNKEFTLYLTSFGFQYGIPQDAELMLDMRFLRNPFYEEALRPQTGLDQPVKDYIFSFPFAKEFLAQWVTILQCLLPHFQQQGKTRLTLAIGCTGGQHRSVCMTEAIAQALQQGQTGYNIVVHHREMARWPKPAEISSLVGDPE
jgi:UPF0042 nucleotide-binding protein